MARYIVETESDLGPGELLEAVVSHIERTRPSFSGRTRVQGMADEGEVVWALGKDDAESLYDYLHHNRPGGYQHVHDGLLEAIHDAD